MTVLRICGYMCFSVMKIKHAKISFKL